MGPPRKFDKAYDPIYRKKYIEFNFKHFGLIYSKLKITKLHQNETDSYYPKTGIDVMANYGYILSAIDVKRMIRRIYATA